MEFELPYLPEFVPNQGNKYERLAEPSVAPIQQRATVLITNPAPPPRDHIVWSLCSLVYVNPFCLGLAAVYFSIKSRDRKVAGDLESAREYGSTARCLNIVTLTLLILGVIVLCVTFHRIVTSFIY